MRRNPEDFHSCDVSNEAAPYLGPLLTDDQGILQWIKIDNLLSPSIRDVLFKQQPTYDVMLNSDAAH